jgi:hypothetical protein
MDKAFSRQVRISSGIRFFERFGIDYCLMPLTVRQEGANLSAGNTGLQRVHIDQRPDKPYDCIVLGRQIRESTLGRIWEVVYFFIRVKRQIKIDQ